MFDRVLNTPLILLYRSLTTLSRSDFANFTPRGQQLYASERQRKHFYAHEIQLVIQEFSWQYIYIRDKGPCKLRIIQIKLSLSRNLFITKYLYFFKKHVGETKRIRWNKIFRSSHQDVL